MSEHPNATLIRRLYSAFATGDLKSFKDSFAENARIHEPGRGAISGDYVGLDNVLDFFRKLIDLTAGTFRAELIDVLADDDRAVVLQHSTAKRDGKALDTRDVLVCEIRDGKIASAQVFAADEDLENAFWSKSNWPRARFFAAEPTSTPPLF